MPAAQTTKTTTITPPVYPLPPYYTNKTKLNKLFSALRSTPQSLTAIAGIKNSVAGANGTVLTFYPNSFKDASGHTITSGTINIQLTEMYKPGQMIANRATATSGGIPLISGGQVCISATKNGQEVYASKYGIAFPQPVTSGQHMNLFYGNTSNADSLVTWTVADTSKAGTRASGTMYDSAYSVNVRYEFDSCANFHWINCDYFYSYSGPLTDIKVVVNDTSFNPSNTEVFLVFPTINSVATLDYYNSATSTFDLSPGHFVSVGFPIDVVVITNKNGNYYYFQQTGITTTNGLSITGHMISHTLSYIAAELSTL